MRENKRQLNGSMCIAFALLFIIIGALQFILGHNRGITAQMIIAVATWAYALALLILGFVAEERKKRSDSGDVFTQDSSDDCAEPQVSDDFNLEPPSQQLTIDDIEQRLSIYASISSPDSAAAAEYRTTGESLRELCTEARRSMQSAEREYNTAVDRAAEAYLNLDDKNSLLRKVTAQTNTSNPNDTSLLQRAQRARDKAKHTAQQADAQVENARLNLDRARQYVSRTSKARRTFEKLASRFNASL